MSSPSLLKLWISGTLLALTAVAQPTYTLTAFNANAVFTDPAGAAPGAAQGSGTGSPGRATFTATLAGQTVTGTMAISAPSPITGTISTAFRQIDGSGFRVLTPTTPQPFTITWSLTGAAQQGNLVVSTGVNFTRQTSISTSFTVSPPEIVLSGTDQTASISAQVGFRFPSRPNVEVAFNALFQWAVAVGGAAPQTTTDTMIPQYPKPQPSTQGSTVRNLVLTPSVTSSAGSLTISFADAQNRTYSGKLDVATAPTVTGTRAPGASVVVLSQATNFTVRWTFGSGSANMTVATTFNQFIPGTSCTGTDGQLNCVIAKDGLLSVLDNGDLAALVTLDLQTAGGGAAYRETWVFSWGATTPAPICPGAGNSAVRAADFVCVADDLAIDHIEVVQSVQQYDRANKKLLVPLVAGRSAVVRVFVRSETPGVLKNIDGEVTVGSEKLIRVPGSVATEAPSGTPETVSRRHSLDFWLPSSQIPAAGGQLTIRAAVVLKNATPPETKLTNNVGTMTIPIPQAGFPELFNIGVATVCVKGAGCGRFPTADERIRIEEWLPARATKVSGLFFPKVTFESLPDDEESWTVALFRLLLEYVRAKHLSDGSRDLLGDIFADRPTPDQLVFGFPAISKTQNSPDLYFGKPGGLGNLWAYDAPFVASRIAHGIGHNYGLSDYISTGPSPIDVVGGDAPYSWDRDRFAPRAFEVAVRAGVVDESRLTGSIMSTPGDSFQISPGEFSALFAGGKTVQDKPTTVPPGQTAVIGGTVAADGQRGALTSVVHAKSSVPVAASDASKDTCVKWEQDRNPVGSFCFAMAIATGTDKGLQLGQREATGEIPFAVAVPFPEGATGLTLTYKGRELAKLVAGTASTVSITSPVGGETWQGTQKIRWTATGNPEFLVQYSPDDGVSWLPLSPGVKTNEFEFDTADMIGGDRCRFRVLAFSGLETTITTTGPLRVPQTVALTPSATEVRFANIAVGLTDTQELLVTNNGTGRALATATQPDNPVFTIESPVAEILGPGDTLRLKLKFSPRSAGQQTGALRIGDKTITLRGGAFTSAVPNLQAPAVIDFGDVQTGQAKTTDFVLINTGAGLLSISSIAPAGAGLSVATSTPLSLDPGGTAKVTLRIANAPAGAQSMRITINSNDPSQAAVSVPVTLRGVAGAVPAAAATGVLNAASFKGAAVAPGEIVTIFASATGPAALTTLALGANGLVATQLGETRVLFDGVPAPIVYSVSGQVAVIVPYSVGARPMTDMTIEYQGRRSSPITLSVARSAPGLFSANSSGTGPGAILNQDSKLNTSSNPAAKGSVITLYGTGEGAVDPPVADGAVNATVFPKPLGAVTGTIGGVNAEVLYAGAAPGLVAGVFQINVRIPATVAGGNQPLLVTIGGNSSQTGLTVAVEGSGPAQVPVIEVTPASLDFGSVTVGQSTTRTITIRNTGAAALTVSFVSGTNAQFAPIDSFPPFTLQSGESRTMTFRYTPSAAGAASGTVTISSNDPQRPSVAVSVTGTGAGAAQAPIIVIEPPSLDFGTVNLGQTKDLSFVVRNTGTASLSVGLVGSSNSQFGSILGLLSGIVANPFTVAPGSSQTVVVRFTPAAAGTQTGTVSFTTNDPARAVVSMNITGTGAATGGGNGGGGGANLLCNGSFEQPGANSSFETLAAGSTRLPCWSVTRSDVDYIRSYWTSFHGDHSIDMDGGTPGSIAQTFATKADTTYTVAFRMSGHPGSPHSLRMTAASQSADFTSDVAGRTYPDMKWELKTFTFRSTSASTTLLVTSLSTSGSFGAGLDDVCVAEGTAPCSNAGSSGGTGATAIEVTPATLDFGSAIIGASISRTITVRNTGGAPLTISFVSSSNAQFVPVDSFPPFTLQPGESRVMTFRFTPTRAAATNGTITISSNDPVRPSIMISFAGTGTAAAVPSLEVSPPSLDFSSVPVNAARDLTATLRNTGTSQASVTATSSNARFIIVSPGTSFNLAAGASQTLTIRFSPLAAGAQTGSIAFGAPGAPTVALSLLGTGTASTGSGGGTNLVGTWTWTATCPAAFGGQFRIDSQQVNGSFTGSFLNTNANDVGTLAGTLTGNAMAFTRSFSGGSQQWTGTVSSNGAQLAMQGTLTGTGGPCSFSAQLISGAGGNGGTAKIAVNAVAGWPNGRASNQTPPLAVDGNITTYTWTTESNSNVNPSYLGIGFAGSTSVSRIRLYKDTDSGVAGPTAKNLVIEYTTGDPTTQLANRTWIPVTGLANGFNGTELLTATSVNANGTVTGDSHNSASSGFASLTFNAVNATGVRVGFSNTASITANHYRVYEFEAYGGGASSGGGSGKTIAFGQTVNGALTASSGRSVDCAPCYADIYTITVSTPRSIVITLTSTAFDAFLNLLSSTNQILTNDDDSGGGLNAKIVGTLSPGVYRIEVTSATPAASGPYTLAIAP